MSNPQAYISVRKSRLRSENQTVYLEKNTEFEIELYNPTDRKVGAQIIINGIKQCATLILRPGESITLERYLDDNKKFLFDTYFVDGSAQSKSAIKNNGGIQVEFYREKITPVYHQQNLININNTYPYFNQQPWFGLDFSSQPVYGTSGTPFNDGFTTTSNMQSRGFSGQSGNLEDDNNWVGALSDRLYSKSVSTDDLESQKYKSPGVNTTEVDNSSILRSASMDFMEQEMPKAAPVETGRVEKGSVSNQTFKSASVDLETWAFHTINFKLLPLSQKPVEIVAVYCTNCGRRARIKENFCPKCGTKHTAE